MHAEHMQVAASRKISVKADTTVALNTSIMFVIDKRAKILVPVGTFLKTCPPVNMPGHQSHVLQMTFAAFIADRTIMGMVEHKEFDNRSPEFLYIGIINRNTNTVQGLGHAGHHNEALIIVFITELLDRTLSAGADGLHGRVPTEVWNVESKR
jgi:hypothetical protein